MFNQKSKKFLIIIFFLLLIITILLENKSLVKKNNLESNNVELAIYIENEQTNSIPTKESGYYYDLEKSSCNNEAYINWDSVSWSPVVKNITSYPTRCELHFTKTYTEGILNGADPIIKDELIPVTIGADGIVTKANLESPWYSYAEKNWANAIILKDESTTLTYEAGSVIPEDAIESYFVWIPKYRYQLWDLGEYEGITEIDTSKAHEIPVIFGDYNTSDEKVGECTTPMESGASGNCEIGDYMTHPAFLSIPSTGFWVGKFETGYDGASSMSEAEKNERNASKIVVKPNLFAWRSIQTANAFYTSYDYKRNLDSHMMKNTEWGAVAYLQHSSYGSSVNVRINNNSSLITGYAANKEPTCGWTTTNEECNKFCNDGTCNTAYPNSVLASTTGNISGIYDMSGGSWEYLMAVMLDSNGNPMSGANNTSNSGFNGQNGDGSITNGFNWPEKKYYDVYLNNNSIANFKNRILGDATGEMGPFAVRQYLTQTRYINSWHNNVSWFFVSTLPLFARGDLYSTGSEGGTMAFASSVGQVDSAHSFRIVLL